MAPTWAGPGLLQKLLDRASPASGNESNIQNRTKVNGPLPIFFFGTVRLIENFTVSSRSPINFFDILQQWIFDPLLHFRHYET